MVGQQPAHLGHCRLAPDEARQLHGQVVGVAVEGAQGREVDAKVGVAQLVDLLRTGQVTHAVGAEVGEAGPGGQVVGHQVCARPGEEDLAAVAEVAQPASTGDSLAEVADLVLQLCFPRVQAHRARRGSSSACQLALDLQGAGDRLRCPGEGGDEGAPLSLSRSAGRRRGGRPRR